MRTYIMMFSHNAYKFVFDCHRHICHLTIHACSIQMLVNLKIDARY